MSSECERLALLYAGEGIKYAKSIASYESLAPLIEGNVGTLVNLRSSVNSVLETGLCGSGVVENQRSCMLTGVVLIGF